MTISQLPRRERDRIRHRQEILDAARALVARRGTAEFTVEEVARASDFAVGSIYRHFRSKEELLELLVCELTAPFFDFVETLAEDPRPFDARFDDYLAAFAEMTAEHLPLMQLFLVAPGGLPLPSSDAGQHLKAASQRYHAAIRALVESGQREGAVCGEDPVALAQALIGLCGTFGRAAALERVGLEQGMSTVRRVFLDGCRST